MEISKEDIIDKYKSLRDYIGKAPSSRIFEKETGIQLKLLEKFYGSNSWAKLVVECGDKPNDFSTSKIDLEEILNQWAKLVRESGKLPAIADWRYNKCKPSINNIKSSHGLLWADLPYKFLEIYSGADEWKDIIALIPRRTVNETLNLNQPTKIEGLSFELLNFIPPIVQRLVEQAINEEESLAFEKNVNLIFQMLGFDVTTYGQGTGRNPDGIAKDNQNHYAIIIDAKSRKDNYKIGTEDRKFIEYIKTHTEPLRKAGFTKVYLLIVSSGFDTLSAAAVKNIKVETQVTTSLLTARLLLKLLSRKIQQPLLFDLKRFQELLIEDGEIEVKKVDKFVGK